MIGRFKTNVELRFARFRPFEGKNACIKIPFLKLNSGHLRKHAYDLTTIQLTMEDPLNLLGNHLKFVREDWLMNGEVVMFERNIINEKMHLNS